MTDKIFKEIHCEYEEGQSMKSDHSAQAIKWPERVLQADFQYHRCETDIKWLQFSDLVLEREKSLSYVCSFSFNAGCSFCIGSLCNTRVFLAVISALCLLHQLSQFCLLGKLRSFVDEGQGLFYNQEHLSQTFNVEVPSYVAGHNLNVPAMEDQRKFGFSPVK